MSAPKTAMGWVKFSMYVGIAILALEATGILDKGRELVGKVSA